jgi:dihydroorotase
LIEKNKITKVANKIKTKATKIIDASGLTIIPGLIDVHVHLREPGYEYKETIKTGTLAAIAGGYSTICCMPNTNPVIDDLKSLKLLKKLINQNAQTEVLPYVSITQKQKGERLVNIPLLAKQCFAFSDDGVGLQSDRLMYQAMQKCYKVNKPIVVHCEDNSQVDNAKEYKEVERDIQFALKCKCQLHICHISTKESIHLIKKAKKNTKQITCEVTPHHLLLNQNDVKDDGKYKMNPPLTDKQSQTALIKAVRDGTIDMIATDHAPHSDLEKNTSYTKSLNGVVGLEFAFSLIYTHLVLKKIINFKRLIELMSSNPAKIFHIKNAGEIKVGNLARLTFVDLHEK